MCRQCDEQTEEIYECCASGTCEVCGGMQGYIRRTVKEENHDDR